MLSFPRVQYGIHCRKGFWDLLGSNFGAPGEKFVFHNRSIEFILKRLLSNHTSVQASFALTLLG